MTRIDKKIVSYSVVKPDEKSKPPEQPVQRTEALSGTTYKVKTPLSEHALYVTINDLDGRPFEIFINSKAMDHFQWMVALTRVISAIFRHGGEVNFLIEELKSVFDPRGGAFVKGKYVPSLVAAIGDILERHLVRLGLYVVDNSLAEAAKLMVAEKLGAGGPSAETGFPDHATLCNKCNTKAVIIMDNCSVCLQCSDSKCG